MSAVRLVILAFAQGMELHRNRSKQRLRLFIAGVGRQARNIAVEAKCQFKERPALADLGPKTAFVGQGIEASDEADRRTLRNRTKTQIAGLIHGARKKPVHDASCADDKTRQETVRQLEPAGLCRSLDQSHALAAKHGVAIAMLR